LARRAPLYWPGRLRLTPLYPCSKQNIKPAKLTWTLAWRRLHKKDKKEEGSKTRRRRAVRTQRAFVGLSVDDMSKKIAAKPTLRAAAKDAALKEAQERCVVGLGALTQC